MNDEIFRIGIFLGEWFGNSFEAIFDVRKVCKDREDKKKVYHVKNLC